MTHHTAQEIAVANEKLGLLKRLDKQNICSSNFPWLITQVSPWDMKLKITSKSVKVFNQSALYTIQRTVAKDKLRSMVSNPKYLLASPCPEVIRVDGVDMIYNGHHRLASFWLYGKTEVECTFLEAERI